MLPRTQVLPFFLGFKTGGVCVSLAASLVLEAMEKIDRGLFVKGYFTDRAYEDMPLPIPCGQTISQPSVVGVGRDALWLHATCVNLLRFACVPVVPELDLSRARQLSQLKAHRVTSHEEPCGMVRVFQAQACLWWF